MLLALLTCWQRTLSPLASPPTGISGILELSKGCLKYAQRQFQPIQIQQHWAVWPSCCFSVHRISLTQLHVPSHGLGVLLLPAPSLAISVPLVALLSIVSTWTDSPRKTWAPSCQICLKSMSGGRGGVRGERGDRFSSLCLIFWQSRITTDIWYNLVEMF